VDAAALPSIVPLLLSLLFCGQSHAQEAESPPPPAPLEGCPLRVERLPGSPLFDAADPRLQGQHLVVVLKQARRSMVFEGGELARSAQGDPACWRVALGVDSSGSYPPGPKRRRGDRRTPEGWYGSSDKPWSSFAPAVAVHYPAVADAEAGLAAGLVDGSQLRAVEQAVSAHQKPPQDTRLGGQILFHGGGSWSDWTWGCIAFDDEDNEAFRARLPTDMRTDVLILP